MSACWGLQWEIRTRYSFGLGVGMGTVVEVRSDGLGVNVLGIRIACMVAICLILRLIYS